MDHRPSYPSAKSAHNHSGILCRLGLQDCCCGSYDLWSLLAFINWDRICCSDSPFTSALPSNSLSCFFVILIFTVVLVVVVEEDVKSLMLLWSPRAPFSSMLFMAFSCMSCPEICLQKFPIFFSLFFEGVMAYRCLCIENKFWAWRGLACYIGRDMVRCRRRRGRKSQTWFVATWDDMMSDLAIACGDHITTLHVMAE